MGGFISLVSWVPPPLRAQLATFAISSNASSFTFPSLFVIRNFLAFSLSQKSSAAFTDLARVRSGFSFTARHAATAAASFGE